MSIVVEAPKEYYGLYRSRWPSLFLAGITGCADWQAELLEKLSNEPVIVYNPRRADFKIGDPAEAEVQICWEFDKLTRADVVSFWFARGTDNPIVLYELGLHGNSHAGRPIAVGADPDYSRRQDVVMQTALARPEIPVLSSLDELAAEIRSILKAFGI